MSFKNDKKNGQVTVTFPNGTEYIGEFKDGKKHIFRTETPKNRPEIATLSYGPLEMPDLCQISRRIQP